MAGRPEPYRRRTRRAHAAGGDRRRARPGAAQPRHAGAAAGGAAPVRQPHAAGRAARRRSLTPPAQHHTHHITSHHAPGPDHRHRRRHLRHQTPRFRPPTPATRPPPPPPREARAPRPRSRPARTVALAAPRKGAGTWLIDAAGQPVGPAMLWLDARAASAIGALRASPAAESITQRTGAALVPSMQSGQLLWLRSHQPERLAQASTALHCKDWLYFKATGERSTCHAESVFTFGNYHSGAYDDEVLALLGLSSLKRL